MRSNSWIALAAAAALVPFPAGCGSGNGGAQTRPTISIKPKTGEKDGGAETASTATSDAKGGTAAPAGGSGNLKGVVTVKGDPPDQKLLIRKGDPNAKDPAVCAAQNVPDESLVVGSNGGLANVFIYMQRAPAGAQVEPAPQDPVEFDQKFCRFLPHAMVVRTGRTINVLNSDAILHNTHTNPLNGATEVFNKGVAPNEQEGIPMVYGGPEKLPVSVVCDIHNWMRAWHLPLDHDFAAVTDEEGNFEIPNLPSGEHEFIIWHEKAGYLDRKYKVAIKPGETTEVNLSFGGEKLLAGPDELKTINISALTR